MFSEVGADWHSLGGVQYEKLEIYPHLDWGGKSEDCRLDQHVVAAAPCGGPIAMVRDEAALVKLVGAALSPPLRLFTAAGRPLAEVPWEGPGAGGGRLVAMGWTEEELLVTVREHGQLQLRDIRGTLLRDVQLLDAPDLSASAHAPSAGDPITHCAVWSDGVVAVTADLRVIAVSGVNSHRPGPAGAVSAQPRLYQMSTAALRRRRPLPSVTALAVVEPAATASAELEVLVALADGDIWTVSEAGATQAPLPEALPSACVELAVAPGGQFVAVFTAGGLLAVLKDGLSAQVMAFDTSTQEPPQQMAWCGRDCVLLHWPGLGVLMVGPGGDWTKLAYPRQNPLVLAPEVDCCRIITQARMELLQRVPDSTEAISRIGSTEPAAMLFDAMEAFEDGDPKADEHIRAMARGDDPYALQGASPEEDLSTLSPTRETPIGSPDAAGSPGMGGRGGSDDGAASSGGMLADAVAACIAAAAAQLAPDKQKALLRAAAYGKGFLPEFDSEDFVACCRKLRVLNSLRDAEVGIPLTAQQYDAIGPHAVIQRLVRRRLHFLALRACQHLKLPSDAVAISWACERLACQDAAAMSDEVLRDLIRDRLSRGNSGGGGSAARAQAKTTYADVARAATLLGRRRLATLLLDLEPLAADQVQLLLAMNEDELALRRAVASGDYDLIALVLLQVEDGRRAAALSLDGSGSGSGKAQQQQQRSDGARSALFRAAQAHPEALSILKAYYSSRSGLAERRQLHALCTFCGQFLDAGTLAVQAAYEQARLEDRLAGLREAEKLFSQSRDLAFQQGSTRDQIELLEAQRDLELKAGLPPGTFLDLSLSDTITKAICMSAIGGGGGGGQGETAAAAALAAHGVDGRGAPVLATEALRLAKRFKVPEKRLWHVRVRALASSGQWAALRLLAAERRSPIGYAPFARAALQHGQPTAEAEHYIERIPQADERFDLFCEAKAWLKAAETAAKLKDPRRLAEVKAMAADPSLSAAIDDLIARGLK